jgi:hypothetical protein
MAKHNIPPTIAVKQRVMIAILAIEGMFGSWKTTILRLRQRPPTHENGRAADG